jgi:tryptophanyl-tRNA synthetase
MKDRIFSGMRPTGKLHLGHLIGALNNWVQLQETHECFYGIVDWHALTTGYEDVSGLRENVTEIALDWLASGLDPTRSTFLIQSQVPTHAELHVLFSMITPIPWLERVPSYKEQQTQLKEKDLSTYGFLGYPLLQAADILVYKARAVPVGEDQVAHIELTREVARRFNNLYGELFPEPQALLTPTPRLLGTDGRKMSKSYNNCVYLSDSPDEIRAKSRTMITDPARIRRSIPGNPEVCNVFDYHKVFTPESKTQEINVGCRSAALGCVDCKAILAENLIQITLPIYEKRVAWEGRRREVHEILEAGSAHARQVTGEVMVNVRRAMNISYGD